MTAENNQVVLCPFLVDFSEEFSSENSFGETRMTKVNEETTDDD